MESYLNLLESLVALSVNPETLRTDRTGVGTYAQFGTKLSFDLQDGFPILTTKSVHFHSVKVELLWFMRGDTNLKFLHQHKVSIWDEWADASGELGPIYGAQWRNWNGENIDQLSQCIDGIKNQPMSRRHIISSWNVSALAAMKLPPCHIVAQFFVEGTTLSCQVYQRSCDVFLGLPFNLASYALLLEIVAARCELTPRHFHWIGGDTHLYQSHSAQAKLQLQRAPRSLPRLVVASHPEDISAYNPEDIYLEDYNPHPAISAPIAV